MPTAHRDFSYVDDRRMRSNLQAQPDLFAERERRIAGYAAAVAQHEMPAHGILPRRGVERPVVILTLVAIGPNGGCLVSPSTTAAGRLIGVESCSICEAIREQRPVRGHVIRYLDQLEGQGQVVDDLFHFDGRHEPAVTFRELLRLTHADADAPGPAPSN